MIRLRPVLVAVLLLSPILSHAYCNNCNGSDCCGCPGEAQCLGSYANCEEACFGRSAPAAPPVYDPEAARRQEEANKAMMEQQAHEWRVELNNEGVQAYKQGNWDLAIQRFTTASTNEPGNALFKQNLDNAIAAKASEERDKANRAEIARNNAAAMQRMGNVMGSLRFDEGAAAPSALPNGLDFASSAPSAGGSAPAGYPPHGDPRIVDARNLPPAVAADIDKSIKGAYPKASPDVVDRLKKAFTAVENKDWKVANAWFLDALKRDPTNVGLQRFVIAAQSPEILKQVKAPPAPPEPLVKPVKTPAPPKPPEKDVIEFFRKFRNGEAQEPSRATRQYVLNLPADDFKYLLALQLPDDRDAELLFAGTPSAALQLPTDKDLEFLFDTTPAPPKLIPGGKN